MFKQIAIAAALGPSASAGLAGTVIGGATLLDTATVIDNTVSPTTFLTHVSGGDGSAGNADGTNYNLLPLTGAQAMNTADHRWLQFDPPILMHSNTALSDVIAVPAIDHGWTAGNTNEFWESFEFIVWGCAGTVFANAACEEGHITKVWTLGVDNSGAAKNADDWTTQWHFNGSYNNSSTLRAIVSTTATARAARSRRAKARSTRSRPRRSPSPKRTPCSRPAWRRSAS